jgi:hypothetical protein
MMNTTEHQAIKAPSCQRKQQFLLPPYC